MTDEQQQNEPASREIGMSVRRLRRARPKVLTNTIVIHEGAENGPEVGCIPVVRGTKLSRRQVAVAAQLAELGKQVLSADDGGYLVEERVASLLDAWADAYGSPWLEPLMRDLETARCDLFAAHLQDVENVSSELEWARATVQKLALLCSEVPEWLSPELAAFLLRKLSFGRGGGPAGAMSSEKMRKRLREPSELAKWLRAQQGRSSRFSAELRVLDEACAKPKPKLTKSIRPADLVDRRWDRDREKR